MTYRRGRDSNDGRPERLADDILGPRIDTAHLLIAAGLVSFAAMGIVHKLGDHHHAEPLSVAFYAVIAAGLLSAARAIMTGGLALSGSTPALLLIALPFGASAGMALWLFQSGLRHGRIATSWLLINLSAAVPTVLSISIYHEALSRRQTIAMLLVVLSLILLWWDRRVAKRAPSGETTAEMA